MVQAGRSGKLHHSAVRTGIAQMDDFASKIRIAAALIHDDAGRLLLVRKAGTQWFMQAGGKIENDESPLHALKRELIEEIGLSISDDIVRYLGCFSSIAANEPDDIVEAEVFHVPCNHDPS